MPVQQLNNNRLQLYRPRFNVPDDRELLRMPSRIESLDNRQQPVDNNRIIQPQRESVPEYTRPARQTVPENQPINRNVNEKVQPAPPARVPVETPRRQSQPVRETEKMQTSPPARVPVETPRRTRPPVPAIPEKEREPERK
jgi:hypothetical protein